MLDNIKNKIDNSSTPLVSISCITFNHGEFIRETLEGFLSQKTSFCFEILIHDDASTDDTVTIIKEYAERFPSIIKPIFQKENQYSKGVRGMNRRFNFPRAQGMYIAMCEGDDYWIDEYKLQKQVDFLENNLSYSGVFHNSFIVDTNSEFLRDSKSGNKLTHFSIENRDYSSEEIANDWVVPTNSFVFKTSALKNFCTHKDILFGDIVLFLNVAKQGKLYGASEVMSCYRRHFGGVSYKITDVFIREKLIRQSFLLEEMFDLDLKKRISREYWSIALLHLRERKLTLFVKFFWRSMKKDFMVCLDCIYKFSLKKINIW